MRAAQVDTFEAVKVNVCALLGELAPRLGEKQLELLFAHFGACAAWPAPMALRAMDLLLVLAAKDEAVRSPRTCRAWRGVGLTTVTCSLCQAHQESSPGQRA